MKRDWMAELASHYEKKRKMYPEEKLIILFDIDGTILDMRYMIFHVLKAYDFNHNTRFFSNLSFEDIRVHENQIDLLLEQFQIPEEKRKEIILWYNQDRWSPSFILESHRPYPGVLEVIRWFQLQPNTFIGLNTGRPESIRKDTLRSLNELGKEYRVSFTDEYLYMNPAGWGKDVSASKVEGIKYFKSKGLRIVAFIDNEPENLSAVSKIDLKKEILLLHAETIFESEKRRLPPNSAKGETFDLTELIPEKDLPRHIQFVWHGVNDEANLRQFLASDITWGECDVRWDPTGNELILRHDSFKNHPLESDEKFQSLESLVTRLHRAGKSIKFDLKAGSYLIDRLLALIEKIGIKKTDLWFNGNVERLHEAGFKKLSSAMPGAILQCPVDFLVPLIESTPEKAREILEMYREWGIVRFSLSWLNQDIRIVFEQMSEWGYEINIYNVPNLEAFLQAVLLVPRSITADFNFPKWHYYGRGSGERGNYYEYTMRKVSRKR